MRSVKSMLALMLVASLGWATGCQSTPPAPTTGPGAPAPKATVAPAASPSASAQVEIQGRYDAIATALKAKDVNAYVAILGDGYKSTSLDGKVKDRKAVESDLPGVLKTMDISEMTVKIKDCAPKGDTVNVSVATSVVATVKDPEGKAHKLEVQVEDSDVWSKTPAGWKMVENKTTKETSMMDGKPFPPAPEAGKSPDAGKAPEAGKGTDDKGDAEGKGDEGDKPEKPEKGEKGE